VGGGAKGLRGQGAGIPPGMPPVGVAVQEGSA